MAATNKTIVLISGANAGIGFELASQLIADKSKHVIVGSRSIEKGEAALKDLQSKGQPGTVEMIQLDVSKRASIEAAAKKVEESRGRRVIALLDCLVSNAGIGSDDKLPLDGQLQQTFAVNAAAPYMMSEAFKHLLQRSTGTPRIVNVSSGAGSIQGRLKIGRRDIMRNAPYCISKAALSMVMAFQATDPALENSKAFLYCPGFTASTLGDRNKVEHGAKPTSVGAAPIVEIVNGERDDESGGFLIGPEMGPEHKGIVEDGKLQLPW